MKQSLMRRLGVTAIGVGALFMAIVASSVSVGAIDPSVFTNNSCDIGNYACLQAAQPTIFTSYGCPVGNYDCLYSATGYPPYQYRYPYYASNMSPYYYQPPFTYTYLVYVPHISTTTAATGTIVSGPVGTAGQQVSATVDGFIAGETVTAAVTGPNGQSALIGSAPAAADGSVTVSLTFPTTGTWQLTLHGQISNRTVVKVYVVQ